ALHNARLGNAAGAVYDTQIHIQGRADQVGAEAAGDEMSAVHGEGHAAVAQGDAIDTAQLGTDKKRFVIWRGPARYLALAETFARFQAGGSAMRGARPDHHGRDHRYSGNAAYDHQVPGHAGHGYGPVKEQWRLSRSWRRLPQTGDGRTTLMPPACD